MLFVNYIWGFDLEMSGAEEELDIKFRLIDGSDIGPKSFPVAMSVATLKENIIAQWPKGSIKAFISFALYLLSLHRGLRFTSLNLKEIVSLSILSGY